MRPNPHRTLLAPKNVRFVRLYTTTTLCTDLVNNTYLGQNADSANKYGRVLASRERDGLRVRPHRG